MEFGSAVLVQVLAHLAMGKETGISAGVAAGLPPYVSGLIAFAQDLAVFALGFPLVVLFEHRLEKSATFGPPLARLRAASAAKGERWRKLGLFGLTMPVWIPFVPLGALGCGIAGLAFGYSPKQLAVVLIAAIGLSCLAWASAYALIL